MAEFALLVFGLLLCIVVTATALYYGTLRALEEFFGNRKINTSELTAND